MSNARVVPVGRHNPTVFVRTDLVASMEIISCPDGTGGVHGYELLIHMTGSRVHRMEFDFKSEAAEAAVLLCNKINGAD